MLPRSQPFEAVHLRPASLTDVDLLLRWDEQPHVLESDPNDDWHWEEELGLTPDWRESLIAEVGGRPIGFLQIIDPAREETRYWGDAPPDCGQSISGSAKLVIWAKATARR